MLHFSSCCRPLPAQGVESEIIVRMVDTVHQNTLLLLKESSFARVME